MSCMSQNLRLFHVSNLSVRNFGIFLLMYTGSVTTGPDRSGFHWPTCRFYRALTGRESRREFDADGDTAECRPTSVHSATLPRPSYVHRLSTLCPPPLSGCPIVGLWPFPSSLQHFPLSVHYRLSVSRAAWTALWSDGGVV